MPSNNTKPVDIRHFRKEWTVFNKRIKELNERNTFNNYLHNRMLSLVKDYKNCPDCILESLADIKKDRKRHYVPDEVYNIFLEISNKSKVPIAAVIDRLIISPLLIEK